MNISKTPFHFTKNDDSFLLGALRVGFWKAARRDENEVGILLLAGWREE
jgi:hypothetical protein